MVLHGKKLVKNPFRYYRVPARVVLDSWAVSQIWLDSDSNESSQSRSAVKIRDESSQSWLTWCLHDHHTDRHLSQNWVNWKLLESKLSHWFLEKSLRFCVYLQYYRERANMQLHSGSFPFSVANQPGIFHLSWYNHPRKIVDPCGGALRNCQFFHM